MGKLTRGELINKYLEKRAKLVAILRKIKDQRSESKSCEHCLDKMKEVIVQKMEKLNIRMESKIIKRARAQRAA